MLINVIMAGAMLLSPNTGAPTAGATVTSNGHVVRRIHTPIANRPVRRPKVLIISIGQSNNGLLSEPADPNPVADAPDSRIRELSQGLYRSGYPVAPAGQCHTFQFPAQDDRGGMCMRLAGAKALLHKYPVIEEITLYCGAEGGTSLAIGEDEWELDGHLTQQAIDWCAPFMAANPDYRVVFWCSLGATDALNGMSPAVYQQRLSDPANKLRTQIPGAQNAFWVQGDMPQPLVDGIDNFRGDGNGTAIWQLQNSVCTFIPCSASATMYNEQVYDGIHIGRAGLRNFGTRMGLATRLR